MRSASPVHFISSAPAIRFVPGTRHSTPIRAMQFLPFVFLLFFFSSCGEPGSAKQDTANGQSIVPQQKKETVSISRSSIGTSGYSIGLPSTHHIQTQQNRNFEMVYYVTPLDTNLHPGEAGMYFGKSPDVQPPSSEYTIREFDTLFLGEKRKWVEYKTEKYIQRETFMPVGDDQYAHFWCYSNDPAELERLFGMMLTLSR